MKNKRTPLIYFNDIIEALTRIENTHEYFRINIDIVWDIITKEIPKTKSLLIDMMWDFLISIDLSIKTVNNEIYLSSKDLYLNDIHYFTYKGLSFTVYNRRNIDAENVRTVILTKTVQHDNCCDIYRFTVPSEGSVNYKIGPVGDCAYAIIVDRDFIEAKPNNLNSIVCDISLWVRPKYPITGNRYIN